MQYVLILVVSMYILFHLIALFSDKYNKNQWSKFNQSLNQRCDSILKSVERTEATIAEERKLYWSLPEEYREQFLAKYNEIEAKCNAIRADVANIRNSIESEVAV